MWSATGFFNQFYNERFFDCKPEVSCVKRFHYIMEKCIVFLLAVGSQYSFLQ